MLTIREYKQVTSLEEAWQLNQKRMNRVLGGMLWLRMTKGNVQTAIDLSGLGLDQIEESEEEFSIGCMVTLRQMRLTAKSFLRSCLRPCTMNCRRKNERTTALEE